MNVLTVVFWLQPTIGPWVSYGPPLYLLVGVLVFGVVHLLWVNNNRYAPLAAMFSDETASQRKLRTGLLYGYVVLSVLIPLVVAIKCMIDLGLRSVWARAYRGRRSGGG
jgi:hypothetical protein